MNEAQVGLVQVLCTCCNARQRVTPTAEEPSGVWGVCVGGSDSSGPCLDHVQGWFGQDIKHHYGRS